MNIQTFRDKFIHHTPTLQNLRGQSAVLVPLVERNGQLFLLYEVRSQLVRQPGEVCFPGGRMENSETPEECAIRETWEELGIPANAIDIIGTLDYLYVRGDCLLHPVLAQVDATILSHLSISADEVADTLLVSLDWLQSHPPVFYRHHQNVDVPGFPFEDVGITADYHWRPHYLEVPIYHGLPYPLWGLTAHITYHLLEK